MTLKVKKLDPRAKLPTVAHPGEDLGYDLYALGNYRIGPFENTTISTGIAVEFDPGVGGLIRDRSSFACMGLRTFGGVIDSGYRGEIRVIMRSDEWHDVLEGQKIAQLVPIACLTGEIEEVTELSDSARQDRGFGSTGAQ